MTVHPTLLQARQTEKRESCIALERHGASSPNVGCRGSSCKLDNLRRHPVWCPHHRRVAQSGRRSCRNTEICQLHQAILRGQDVCALDIAVYHSLVVEIEQAMQNLCQVNPHQVFREFPKVFANAMQGPIFAISLYGNLMISTYSYLPPTKKKEGKDIVAKSGSYSRMM